jgi:F0F1-type ATP synthase membrane subunit c/vacuolar-type H+-ATPase subunit K
MVATQTKEPFLPMAFENEEELSKVVRVLGVALLVVLSVSGTCEGMIVTGAASTLQAQRKSIITYAFLAMLVASTIFFYAFIIALIAVGTLGGGGDLSRGMQVFGSCAVFGVIALVAGKAVSGATRRGFYVLSKKPEFFTSFLIQLSTTEALLIFALLCSLTMITRS